MAVSTSHIIIIIIIIILCTCGGYENYHSQGGYPVWGVVDGVQQMRIGVRPRFSDLSVMQSNNLNPDKYKQYGWRGHQYSGDPFAIHRWYNDPQTTANHWPSTPSPTDGEHIWGDRSMATAVSLATGYDDNVDNEGADGSFQYPDQIGSCHRNF